MTRMGKKSHFKLNFIDSPFTLLFALCPMLYALCLFITS